MEDITGIPNQNNTLINQTVVVVLFSYHSVESLLEIFTYRSTQDSAANLSGRGVQLICTVILIVNTMLRDMEKHIQRNLSIIPSMN